MIVIVLCLLNALLQLKHNSQIGEQNLGIMNNSSTFRRAAKQSLGMSRSNYSYKLFQELGNDYEFNLIANQKTTYLTEDGKQISASDLATLTKQNVPEKESHLGAYNYPEQSQYRDGDSVINRVKESEQSSIHDDTLFKSTIGNKNISKINKGNLNEISSTSQLKPVTTEIQHSSLKNSSILSNNSGSAYVEKASRIMNSRAKRSKPYGGSFLPDTDLNSIESLIDEIDIVMRRNAPLISASQEIQESQFLAKKGSLRGNNKDKFRNQWNQSFNMMNKLDDMLLGYRTNQPEQETQNWNSKSKNQQPLDDKFKDEQYENEYLEGQENEFNEQLPQTDEKQPITLVILINWNSLPVLPVPFHQVFLKFQVYPQQTTYEDLLKKVLQKQINHFSIFYRHENTPKNIAGVGQSQQKDALCLLSEEEYAMKWESAFTGKSTLTEQESETLLEYDIEWYRAIVDYVFSGGLQQVLERSQGYDIEKYIKLVRQISNNSEVAKDSQIIHDTKMDYISAQVRVQLSSQKKNSNPFLILATKNTVTGKISEVYPGSFFDLENEQTLSLVSQSNSDIAKQKENGQIAVNEDLLFTISSYGDQSQAQNSISSFSQSQFETIFQIFSIGKDAQLQMRTAKQNPQSRRYQSRQKDETPFGNIYGIYLS